MKSVCSLIEPLKEEYDVVVGVHLRRGDYKQYLDGKFYFDDQVYVRAMKKMLDQLNGNVCFVVCSDDEIDNSAFSEFNVFQHVSANKSPQWAITDRSAIQDLYTLSMCDYIVWSPSTFSMWASFCGHVKLKFIESPQFDIDLKDFAPIIQQNLFTNGKTYP